MRANILHKQRRKGKISTEITIFHFCSPTPCAFTSFHLAYLDLRNRRKAPNSARDQLKTGVCKRRDRNSNPLRSIGPLPRRSANHTASVRHPGRAAGAVCLNRTSTAPSAAAILFFVRSHSCARLKSSLRFGMAHGNSHHHRKDQPGEGPARGARRPLRADPAGRGPPAAARRAPRGQCRLEELGLRAAEARRALSDARRRAGQQAGEAQGHRGGAQALRAM